MRKTTILTALIMLMAVFTAQSQIAVAPANGDGSTGNPYEIATLDNLYWITQNSGEWDKNYIQTADIDATSTNTWDVGDHDGDSGTPDVAMGFSPIGNSTLKFTGTYNGQGHTIDSLFINRPNTDMIGMFGYLENASIDSIGIINIDVTGNNYVGGISGYLVNSTINKSYCAGEINGFSRVGGLVGQNYDNSTIYYSYFSGDINSTGVYTGGLVGYNDNYSTINYSYNLGNVSSTSSTVGGLVGQNINYSTINNSYNQGDVTSDGYAVGGLVGSNKSNAIINNSYNNSSVMGVNDVGGFAGANFSSINNVYSFGSVIGENGVGGLVGGNYTNNSEINKSYSVSIVAGTSNVGGLVGGNYSVITNSFYNIDSTATSAGGTGLTTAEMQKMCVYADSTWDFMQETVNGTDDIWGLNSSENGGYPFLVWQGYSHTATTCGCNNPMIGIGTTADPYQVATLDDLQYLSENSCIWDKHFIQTADIDATETNTWNVGDHDGDAGTADEAMGFSPIGEWSPSFTGTYNGKGHTIDSLYINRPTQERIGLFGQTNGASIDSLGVTNVNFNAYATSGGLVAWNINSTINACFSSGTIVADGMLGGLIGYLKDGTITNSYSKTNVEANYGVGGLVAEPDGNTEDIITNCYSIGQITTGDPNSSGGLIGSYSNANLTLTNSFWNIDIYSANNGVGTGLTTAEMKQMCVYADSTWDFMAETVNGTDNIWGLNANENGGYPFLAWQGYSHTESCCGYVDLENPTFTPQNTTIYVDATGNATLIADSVLTNASDNCLISDTTISQTSFDCSNVSTPLNIDVTLTDTTGNFITEQVTVTVADTTNPTITCIGNQVITLTSGQTEYTVVGTEFDPTATDDNCNVASTVNDINSSATLDGETLAIGTTTITWTVTDDNGNTTDCSFDVQVDAYVGINNIVSENGISLYPNPANNYIVIASVAKQSIQDIEILDITGKVVLNVIASKAKQSQTIDISALKQGIYFVKLTTNNSTEVLRFIKK